MRSQTEWRDVCSLFSLPSLVSPCSLQTVSDYLCWQADKDNPELWKNITNRTPVPYGRAKHKI